MSEPWEDFAQGKAASDTPPWEDFAAGGISKSNATQDQYPLLTKLGLTKERAATFNKVMTASPALDNAQGFAAFPNEILKQANLQNAVMLPFLSEAAVTKLPTLAKAFLGSVFAKQAAEQAGTAAGKASVTGLPNLPISPASIDVPIGLAVAGQKPQYGGTTEQWQSLGEVVNALLSGAGAAGVMRGKAPSSSGIGPGDIVDVGYSRVPEERQLQSPSQIIPQERQLPRFVETEQIGMTQPSSGQVTELRSTTGSQFVTDSKGRTIDVSQLTPWEEARVMADIRRGPEPLQGPPAPPWQEQKLLPAPETQFEAGPTTLKQTLSNVEQQLKGEEPVLPTQQRLHSGLNIDSEDLRPAIQLVGRVLIGERGDTHNDILKRNGMSAEEISHYDPRRVFATSDGKQVFDRQQTAAIIGKGTAAAGGADSMDLPGASSSALDRLINKMGGAKGEPIKTQQNLRRARGRGTDDRQLSYLSGVPVPELDKAWEGFKKWFRPTVTKAAEGWTPIRDPAQMKTEVLESKTATPITSKVAGVTLPTEGPETTLADKLIGTKNAFAKKIASVQDLVSKGDKMYSPMDVIFDMADGDKATFDGPLFQNIRWPLDFDFNAELNLRKQKMDPVRSIVKDENLKEKNGLRIQIYSYVKQGFRDRMIKQGIPATYIDNVVKTISPGELRAYEAARRQMDSTFPAIQTLAKDLYDIDLKPIENYSPIHADRRAAAPEELAKPSGGKEAVADDVINFLQTDFRQGGTKTAQGFIEPRLPNTQTMMKMNFFDVYERHIKDVAHFLASQKRLTEIAKIVRDEKFSEKYGDVTQKLTMDWLNAYAKQGRNINALPQLDWMRKAIARGVLGFRVASQFVHLANVPLGMQRAGSANYTRGLSAAMTDAGQAFLRKNLAETFERGGGELELLEKQGSIEKAAFRPQRELDKWNSQATALGIYLREGGSLDGPVNQQALAKARVEARRAVASPLYKDLPPLLRTQQGKILAQFQNTFMDQWSNIRYDLPQYLRNDPVKAMGLMVALSAMVMVESGIKHGVKKGLQAATGYEPKHADEDTYWKKVGHEALRRIPGYGQISSAFEYGSTGVPMLDVVREEAKAVKTAVTSEDRVGRELAAVQAATGAGEMMGVTGIGQASEVIQNAVKAKEFKPHSKRIKEVADKAGLDLSDFDQRLASEAYLKETREPMTEVEKTKSAQTAIKNMSERRQVVMNALSKEDRQWLKTNKIEPPGFGDYLEQAKIRVPYTDQENKFATEMYKTEYENVISFLRNDPGFKQLDRNDQQLVANEAFRDAAKRAREQTEEVVKSGALVEKQKKKKRFSVFSPE